MKLNRPLIFFDLETTGTNVTRDRIVEISLVKVYPGTEEVKKYTQRVNPEMPIPAEATAVHHITDSDVAEAPKFAEIAQGIADTFKDSDIAGFNSNKFDLPMLCQEMARVNVLFDIRKANLIDVQTIYHKHEPRNLSAAYKFYCNKDLEGAHSALADTLATLEIFKAQLERYDDLPESMEEIAKLSAFGNNVDLMGRFIRNDKNQIIINFGQHKGRPLVDVLRQDRSYYDWMISKDFAFDTKRVLTEVFNSLKL